MITRKQLTLVLLALTLAGFVARAARAQSFDPLSEVHTGGSPAIEGAPAFGCGPFTAYERRFPPGLSCSPLARRPPFAPSRGVR